MTDFDNCIKLNKTLSGHLSAIDRKITRDIVWQVVRGLEDRVLFASSTVITAIQDSMDTSIYHIPYGVYPDE